MTSLLLAHVVLGAALGRLFKVLILAPLTAAIALIVYIEPCFWPHSALPKSIQVLALSASLQLGYTLSMWPQCLAAMLRQYINFRPEPVTGAGAGVEKKASGHPNPGRV